MKTTLIHINQKIRNSFNKCSKRNRLTQTGGILLYWLICISTCAMLSCTNTVFHENTKSVTIDASLYISPEDGQSWICEYADSNGKLIEIPISNSTTDITIEYPINTVFPVRFRLSNSTSVISRYTNSEHFGMIIPFSAQIDVYTSAASDIFFTVLMSSHNTPEQSMLYCSCFNWEKLIQTLHKYTDPYELDLNAASADIAHGRFTSKSLRKPLP